jgi:predicted patatin/cPLA2 family phospholipase
MKIGLVSGGGSRGVFGVGQAEKLGSNYDIFYGWSTGALIAPLWSIGDFETLKSLYFNVNNKDIFNVYPFDKSGNLNVLMLLKRLLLGKKTVGEMLPLKGLIDKYFTEDKWNQLQKSGKEVIIGASCVKNKYFSVKYFSSKEETYENFKMAMFASASPPLIGSLVEINGIEYTDAGTVEVINFTNALNKGATYIDAIIHKIEIEELVSASYINNIKSIGDYVGRLLPSLENNTPIEVIKLGKEWAEAKGCKTNIIYMPYEPDFKSFQFDPVKMKQFYDDTTK